MITIETYLTSIAFLDASSLFFLCTKLLNEHNDRTRLNAGIFDSSNTKIDVIHIDQDTTLFEIEQNIQETDSVAKKTNYLKRFTNEPKIPTENKLYYIDKLNNNVQVSYKDIEDYASKYGININKTPISIHCEDSIYKLKYTDFGAGTVLYNYKHHKSKSNILSTNKHKLVNFVIYKKYNYISNMVFLKFCTGLSFGLTLGTTLICFI